MHSRVLSGAGLAVVAAVMLWGCGKTTPPAGPSGNQTNTVTVNIVGSIGNAAYRPNPVSVKAGDTVVFKNGDSTMHHIVLDDGSADLGDVNPGANSRSFTVKSASAVNFHCMLHPSMVGAFNTTAPPEPPPCNDPYGYNC
jgi:plastocyanin